MLQTGLKFNWMTGWTLGSDWSGKYHHLLPLCLIADGVTLHTLNAGLLVKCEQITGVLSSLCLCLAFMHPIKQVAEVFSSVLLLTSLEVWVALPDKVLEHLRSNSILVIFVRLICGGKILCVHLLCKLLLTVFSGEKALGNLVDLTLVAVRGVFLAFIEVIEGVWQEVVLEF